jgi:hypothetical protein
MEKAHKLTTVILDGRIDQARETVWVQMVAVWLVILFVARVINQKSIQGWETANDDAVHRVCLVFGALDVAIFFMVEISQREKWNPGLLIMSNAVDKEELGGQPTRLFSKNGIHHPCRMCDCMEPECAKHLFFGEVGATHMDHHFPMQLNKSVG